MKNTLLEIGTEHLPARFLLPTLSQMETLAKDILASYNLKYESLRAFGTYKRLALEIKNLAPKSEDIQKEVKGPPAALLKNKEGAFTPQAAGFAAKNGIKPEQLVIVETEKGPFIYAKIKIKGQSTAKLLPAVFEQIIKGLTFTKNMVWEEGGFLFARPIRSLMGLYGATAINFSVAGVKSARGTYPLSSFGRKPIKVKDADSYIEILRNQPQPILVEIDERKAVLIKSLTAAANALGYEADMDEDLITETVSFTEHPIALSGDFDARFLTLPKELTTTVLKKQIKMFPVLNVKCELQPHFIAVRDGISVNQDEVRTGFKNVMTARLTDAVFFFENDKERGLDNMRQKLETVNFIDGMGNMLQKTQRVEKLTAELAKSLNFTQQQTKDAELAAKYCYADLTSGVVYEFPELQGYMGSIYAGAAGFTAAAQDAMAEFYLPLTASSCLPKNKEGALVSLAGKLDTLAANFAMGQIPTGSEDPYALRRQAMGAVRIILDQNINITLADLTAAAATLLPEVQNSKIAELEGFLLQRFINVLEQEGISGDEIAAVLDIKGKSLPELKTIAQVLHEARQNGELAAVGQSAKRVTNILKGKEAGNTIDEALLKEPAEQTLYAAYKQIKEALLAIPVPLTQASCKEVFKQLAAFKNPLEDFFAKVMVAADDEQIRNNRLALLNGINVLLSGTADLSKLK